jgi:F-type H+-transporting ATPase subunit b
MFTTHLLMLLTPLAERLEFANYPGLELWKFLNLAIFLTLGLLILRKPVSSALAARGESIKRELEQAKLESDKASEKLAESEALLAKVNDDVGSIRIQAEQEANAERQRQAATGDHEIQRLKTQAARELETARKTAQKGLQQFLANRSLELATQSVKNELRPEDDLRLIRDRIGELRRARG